MKRFLVGALVCGLSAVVVAAVTSFDGHRQASSRETTVVSLPQSANEKGLKRINDARRNLIEAMEKLRLAQEGGQDAEVVKRLRAAASQRRAALRKAYEISAGDFLAAADRNVADGCYNLGMCYLDGNGVLKDELKARKLFERAVESDPNHAAALNQLGECLRDGRGCEADAEEAVRQFERSARLGDARGELNYGLTLLASGKDGEADVAVVSNGVAFLRRAAEKRLPEAMDHYARCLMDGVGYVPRTANAFLGEDVKAVAAANEAEVARRQHEAVSWWFNCANRYRHPDAMVNLAHCFRDGKGVDRRPRAAVYWYYRAAMDYDDVTAMWEMARCCEEGLGGLDAYGGPEKRHFNANWWRTRAKATEGDRLAGIWLSAHDPFLFNQLNLLPSRE